MPRDLSIQENLADATPPNERPWPWVPEFAVTTPNSAALAMTAGPHNRLLKPRALLYRAPNQ
jgi:hypothetical protein